MDMSRKVMVKSNSNATVVYYLPDLNFTRTFELSMYYCPFFADQNIEAQSI